MNVHVLPGGLLETNAYLLTQPGRADAVLIDAPGNIWPDVKSILDREKCKLTQLWLTHGHWDHTQGAAEVVRQTGAKVFGQVDDRIMFETPEIMDMGMGLTLEPVTVNQWVVQGEKLDALGTQAEVRHVPGHCPGNVLFYFPAEGWAFVGDALFKSSVGRADLPGGNFHVLEASIRNQIYTLPDQTTVFPGHGADTTVGIEKKTNPYVRPA